MRSLCSFETLGTKHPVTQWHVHKTWVLTWFLSPTFNFAGASVQAPARMLTGTQTSSWLLFINIDQLDALNFVISLFQASTCFKHMCSRQEGKIVLYSLWYHHTYRWPSSAQVETVLSQPVHRTATYRCDDTRDCIIQFCPPDNEHMCSKHVEAWNKLIIKFSVSSWSILINKYNEMHGQQNIKKKKIQLALPTSSCCEQQNGI